MINVFLKGAKSPDQVMSWLKLILWLGYLNLFLCNNWNNLNAQQKLKPYYSCKPVCMYLYTGIFTTYCTCIFRVIDFFMISMMATTVVYFFMDFTCFMLFL